MAFYRFSLKKNLKSNYTRPESNSTFSWSYGLMGLGMAWSLGRCWATRHAHSPRPSLPPFHLSFPLVRRRKLAPPRLLRRLKSVTEGAAGCFPASKAHRRQIRRERRQPPPRELRETISDVRALRQSPLSLVAPVHASGAACILLLPRCRILARDHPYAYPRLNLRSNYSFVSENIGGSTEPQCFSCCY